MEKPNIVSYHESQIEFQKEEARNKGIEFVDNFDLEEDLKCRIQNIKMGRTSPFQPGSILSGDNLIELEYALDYLKWDKSNKGKEVGYINGTTRQSTLAIYYMQKEKKFPRTTGNKTEDAAFVKFLIGKDFDEIRKLLADPLKRPDEKTGKATQSLINDLTIVLNQFKKIQYSEGAKLVENDLYKLENDLMGFNPD